MKKYIVPVIFGILIVLAVFTLAIDIPIFLSSHDLHLPKNFLSAKLPRAFIVLSGSMEPAVKVGGIVIVNKSADYQQGDIITFAPDGNTKNLVTHRIVVKNYPDGNDKPPVYLTSGDANKDFDSWKITDNEIQGKVVLTLPYLGYFANFAKTPKGFILLVIVPATIIIYEELRNLGVELLKGLKKVKKSSDNERKSLPKITMIVPVFGALMVFLAMTNSFFFDKEVSTGNSFTYNAPPPEEGIVPNTPLIQGSFSLDNFVSGTEAEPTLEPTPEPEVTPEVTPTGSETLGVGDQTEPTPTLPEPEAQGAGGQTEPLPTETVEPTLGL